jgi:hypothetical protein
MILVLAGNRRSIVTTALSSLICVKKEEERKEETHWGFKPFMYLWTRTTLSSMLICSSSLSMTLAA